MQQCCCLQLRTGLPSWTARLRWVWVGWGLGLAPPGQHALWAGRREATAIPASQQEARPHACMHQHVRPLLPPAPSRLPRPPPTPIHPAMLTLMRQQRQQRPQQLRQPGGAPVPRVVRKHHTSQPHLHARAAARNCAAGTTATWGSSAGGCYGCARRQRSRGGAGSCMQEAVCFWAGHASCGVGDGAGG